jgi:hypothetical protein
VAQLEAVNISSVTELQCYAAGLVVGHNCLARGLFGGLPSFSWQAVREILFFILFFIHFAKLFQNLGKQTYYHCGSWR